MAAAAATSPETHTNLDAIDAVFSATSGLSGLLGSLDVNCELLVTGGLSPRAKGASSLGPSGVHTFVQLTSQKSGYYPNRVILSVDDLTGEIECIKGIDQWNEDHVSFRVDLGKKSLSKKKADEIKAMIREHNRSPSHDTVPSFRVSRAALEILGFNTTPVGPIDTLFNIFEQFAGYKISYTFTTFTGWRPYSVDKDSYTWDLTAFADRISDASKHRGATHAEFDAAIASCLGDGKTIEDLRDQDPPFYAAIHTIERLFMLFLVSHSSISRPVPSVVNRAESCQFPFRPPGDDTAASSHEITYSKRTPHNFGDVDQLVYARSNRQQLLQSSLVSKQAAETACDAVTRLGRHYSTYAEYGRISQVMQHLDAVHDELFGSDGMVKKWTDHGRRYSDDGDLYYNHADSHYIDWVERYGTLCKLVTLLCKQARSAGERGQADPELMNKIGILVQTMMMFMDVSVIAPDDSIEFCGLYHFFSKMEKDEAGKKMKPCPVKPWEVDKDHCQDADGTSDLFYRAVGTPCKAFLRVKDLHKVSKEELLERIFTPIDPARDVHDCLREEETARTLSQLAARDASRRA